MEDVQRSDEEFFGKVEVKTDVTVLQPRARRFYLGDMAWEQPILKVREMVCNECQNILDFEVTNDREARIRKPDVEMVCDKCGHKDNWWGMRVMEYGGACNGVIFIAGERRI